MRRRTAALILAGTAITAGTLIRIAESGSAAALAAGAAAATARGAPVLIVVTDPQCPACRAALEELREVVRPGELGLTVRILEGDGAGAPLLEASGPGLVPLWVVVDASGRPAAVLRGPRPPAVLRRWLEGAMAGALAMPLDRGEDPGPP